MNDAGWDQVFREAGYAWCRPCGEWHRPPECSIDEQGRSALDVALGEPTGGPAPGHGDR